ncbi:MAG: cysteine--tRNA ligase, partial [Defluviitoga tunisiensis]
KVTIVQNFTDIDDKIINQAYKEQVSFDKIAKRYIIEYWKDMVALKVRAFNFHPKTSNYIGEIISYIDNLIKKGFAYTAENGDVYFNVRKLTNYGELSHRNTKDLISGSRIDISEYKKDPLDFALWKSSKEGEPFWNSPWGKGRPGWHIECTVMATELLGDTFDIHAGGNDLIFPHHENERAQAIANEKQFAKYWMHNGMIQLSQNKMSKSLGNVWLVRDLLRQFDPDVLKVFIFSKHYRAPIDISEDLLRSQAISVKRIKRSLNESEEYFQGVVPYSKEGEYFKEQENYLLEHLSNDFNTPSAIARLFELSRELNKALNSKKDEMIIDNYYLIKNVYGSIFGIFESDTKEEMSEQDTENIINVLLEVRSTLRNKKLYDLSDYIRDSLQEIGIELKDTPEGTKYIFKSDKS